MRDAKLETVTDSRMAAADTIHRLLLPVLPLRELSLFPEASLEVHVARAASLRALDLAARTGHRLLAIAQRDVAANPTVKNLHEVGTVAELTSSVPLSDGSRRIDLDGVSRARVCAAYSAETLIGECEPLAEGEPGEDWGPAVEALARYLHSHGELRAFLDRQRRSREPMAWVNLACQHLPITASARQKLLDADAPSRCQKISRGLDALLRKEKGD